VRDGLGLGFVILTFFLGIAAITWAVKHGDAELERAKRCAALIEIANG
jgi:hypothetical protein